MRQELIRFLEFTQSSCIKPQERISKGEFPSMWNEDDWHMEVSKCLLVGRDTYDVYNPPTRMWDNPFYNKKELSEKAQVKLDTVEVLKKINGDADSIFVCEVGRGLDILVAYNVKNWSSVLCYDYFDYSSILEHFFKGKVSDLRFTLSESTDFDFGSIDRKVILIANNVTSIQSEKIIACTNKNIVHIIWNGGLLV